MAKITFGFGNSVVKPYETLGDVMDDTNLQALLGFGDNVAFFVNGMESEDRALPLGEDDNVSIQTQASTKA